MTKTNLSPKEYLRARRPEKFSDSIVEEVSELDRSILELHLDTITGKKQEADFECFARALCEREVCPNLLPQTGPTGGGDSKVDSETYPVADSLALAWYSGIGREAASERWGFAFSAKKKWRDKLKSDVKAIKETDRSYKKAFFVSNQLVRDKARGELEDELRKEHGIDVRILDRTWILNKVFGTGHQELAIEELGVSPSIRPEKKTGPRDLERESTLQELESRISQALMSGPQGFQLVEDCIDAAVISRELERPQHETLGRFERANDVAAKYGTSHQLVRCAYDRAWTTFFWFEDLDKFAELYTTVEDRAKGTENVYELELLTNLWQLLHGHARDKTGVSGHTDLLLNELTRLAGQEHRRSSSLQANSLMLTVRLGLSFAAKEPIDAILNEYLELIRQSEGLLGFPLEPVVECLTALGEFLNGISAYDELHEALVEIVAERKGEIAAARLLVSRGEQQLDADRPNDAIRSLGKAFHRLAKNESRHLLCHALYLCACAYERIGLLWAARGTLLAAATISIDDLWKYEDVTPFQASCFRRLKWIELQLGRIPQILSWHELDAVIRGVLVAQGYDRARLTEGDLEFDATLGILLLKTDFWQLKNLSQLPDRLSALGLEHASIALLFALGHESPFDEGAEFESGDGDKESFFLKWRDQPASEELPDEPLLCNEMRVSFGTSVLGCRITVECPNESPFVEVAESVLAAIEGALATGLVGQLFAREPSFPIELRKSDFCEPPFDCEVKVESGQPKMTINCRSFDCNTMSHEEQHAVKERMVEVLAKTIGHVVRIETEQIEELIADDFAFHRADLTGSFQTLANVLGDDRKQYTSDWIDGSDQQCNIRRDKPWDHDSPVQPRKISPPKADAERGDTDDNWQPDLERAKHSQVETISLIRESLWNEANWKGIRYCTAPDSVPYFALAFGNRAPAEQIFKNWQSEIGARDTNELLRVSVIRGISKQHPHHYRVVIGANVDAHQLRHETSFFGVIQRIHEMNPSSNQNLERFLDAYEAIGAYAIAPAVINDEVAVPEPIWELAILKRELILKDAWQVGPNDLDGSGIYPSDDPIIPERTRDAPIMELMKRKLDAFTRRHDKHESVAESRRKRRKQLEKQRRQSKRKSNRRQK